MGCADLRTLQILYSAIKLPLLLGVTYAVSLPGFFAINSIVGVRDDFASVLRALTSAQSWLTLTMLSLAPLILFGYVSTQDHELRILYNVVAFVVASIAGQIALHRDY